MMCKVGRGLMVFMSVLWVMDIYVYAPAGECLIQHTHVRTNTHRERERETHTHTQRQKTYI